MYSPFIWTPLQGVFFGENFTEYSFKTQFTTFPLKVCTNLYL